MCRILAIASDREVGVMGQLRQQCDGLRGVRLTHLGPILPRESVPPRRGIRLLTKLQRGGARCKRRIPDVVPVLAREFGLGHAARRSSDGADAESFIGPSRRAEANDAYRHGPRLRRWIATLTSCTTTSSSPRDCVPSPAGAARM